MKTKSRVGRASQLASAVTLGTFTVAASATPFSLQGVCHLSTTAAGQGTCQLEYLLSDDFMAPTTVRLALIKVDNIVVAQYNNDITTPVLSSASTVSGFVNVACGVNHTVLAYIAPDPTTVYQKVGALPPIKCPTAP